MRTYNSPEPCSSADLLDLYSSHLILDLVLQVLWVIYQSRVIGSALQPSCTFHCNFIWDSKAQNHSLSHSRVRLSLSKLPAPLYILIHGFVLSDPAHFTPQLLAIISKTPLWCHWFYLLYSRWLVMQSILDFFYYYLATLILVISSIKYLEPFLQQDSSALIPLPSYTTMGSTGPKRQITHTFWHGTAWPEKLIASDAQSSNSNIWNWRPTVSDTTSWRRKWKEQAR